jgi:hypothetical protein
MRKSGRSMQRGLRPKAGSFLSEASCRCFKMFCRLLKAAVYFVSFPVSFLALKKFLKSSKNVCISRGKRLE